MPDKPLSIKVTIEIEGAPDDVAAWLARLPRNGGVSVSPSQWTQELARSFASRLSDKARQAVWHIAQGAPSVSFRSVQKAMKVHGVGLGGILASVGFAERAGFPRPYTANHKTRQYEMDPDVARVLIEAIEEIEG